MNRVHKYRAYLRASREMAEVSDLIMYDDDDCADSGNRGEVFVRGNRVNSFYSPEEAELMQWTGERDAAGVDVYEQDLVSGWVPDSERDREVKLAVVGFSEGEYSLFEFDPDGEDHLGAYVGDLGSCCLNRSVTVVGNTCQNPELLEANDA